MVARLVRDAIWRGRWMYVAGFVMLLPSWHLFGQRRPNALPISVMAASLMLTLVQGPMFGVAIMGLRALRHLPFTNREVWRATWFLATVVPAGILLASKATSMLLVRASGGNPHVSAEAMLVSVVYDFIWAAALLPVFPFLVFAESRLGDRGGPLASLAEAGQAVGLLACFGLPILISDALPARVDEFTPVTAGMLMACLAIALGTLAWTPRRGMLAGERARPQRPVTPARVAIRTRLADRLTGISRVAVPYLFAMFVLPVGACLAFASYGMITGSGPPWFVPQSRELFDPADTGERGLTYFVLLPAMIVTILGLWTPWVRLLKVLPLSVRQINALLLVTPFAGWTILWALGWSAYSLAYGAPQTLRVELALGMAGLGALVHAVLLRFQGATAWLCLFAIIGGVTPQLVKIGVRGEPVTPVAFVVLGAIALCAAAFVNHHTLTRSTSSAPSYRLPQAFGVARLPEMQ